MFPSVRPLLAAAAVLALTADPSAAQGVKLEFANGRVNLSAQNVPVRVILAEWARLGGTRIVNGERVQGGPLTVELAGVPERQALDIILRDVPGYMLAAREDAGRGASHFDRIMIMATTTAPRTTPAATFSSAPPPFATADPDAIEDAAQRARELAAEALRRRTEEQNRAGIVNPAVTARPGVPPPFTEATDAPRPATPPPPAPIPGNPFVTQAGSSTPGTIAPIPQQQQQPQPANPPK